ncbi:MAG: peptidylprolyl isomerase [Bacteroidetes bacterium]|nr:peptidylprolyl isomerase [Bacteroidota bacterium]
MMTYYRLLGLLLIFCWGCTQSPNKFSDPVIERIAEFQDRRQTDSLIHYLLSKEPNYRTEAAKALASVQDSAASMQLGNMLLEDPIVEARTAAAFALGQTPGTASANALIPALQDKESVVLREVLEGLGKTIRSYDLAALKSFKAKDSLTQEGLVWAYYQLGTRGLADSIIVQKAIQFLNPTYSFQTRLGAAHFLSRTPKIKIEKDYQLVAEASTKDVSPLVRMAATNSLRKLDSAKSIPVLVNALRDEDYRVRISAVRALATWSSIKPQKLVITALSDTDESVGVAASEAIKPIAELYDALLAEARRATNSRIQSNLYNAVLSLKPSEEIIQEIKNLYQTSKDPYQQAQLLNSFSPAVAAQEFVANEVIQTNSLVVKSTGTQALANMLQRPEADVKIKTSIAAAFQKIIQQGDPGALGIAAATLTEPSYEFKKIIKDYTFLKEAKAKLSLPKDIEALQPLEEAIAYFEGTAKPLPLKNQFNHPIDWEFVKTINKNQLAKLNTSKGEVIIRLLVEEAPGSVANFVQLAKKNYFNGKYFHRVVPNFVAQAGCNRGDGYGSEDYSIRSEFSSRRYQEGSIGMASAGKDTEGTQWFITHSPTPHLNGKYTIFAEVVKGMEVVHRLQVGDSILSVALD